MQLQFFGAAQRVTGSKHLITTQNGHRILLDCGLFQGIDTQDLNLDFGFDAAQIDVLVLSHAHIDHSGLIPRLVSQGFAGSIICTHATKDLCGLLLGDSARIQASDTERLNKKRIQHGEALQEALYAQEDVEKALSLFVSVNYHEVFEVCKGVTAEFFDAGHVLGSAGVLLHIEDEGQTKRLYFTGDIGRPNDKILRSPEAFPQVDYLITESTYGNRLHQPEEDVKGHLRAIVERICVNQRGKLIIPAFSIDRTQELIYALDQLSASGQLPVIKVFIDSPLSVNATKVMAKHQECFNSEILNYLKKDGDPFDFPNLFYVSSTEDSKKINDLKEPCIIISASGMAEAGRIKHHIANNIMDENSAVLLVGYTSPSSLGGQLKAGNKKVYIFGKPYDVKAEVVVMDSFSAHADYQEMIEFLGCQDKSKVKRTFLVHGEIDTQTAYKTRLEAVGWQNIEIPAMKQSYQL
jgi:metallo-beta-lactamase family protein